MGFLDNLVDRINWAGMDEDEAVQAVIEREVKGKELPANLAKYQDSIMNLANDKHHQDYNRGMFSGDDKIAIRAALQRYVNTNKHLAQATSVLTDPNVQSSLKTFDVGEEALDQAFSGYSAQIEHAVGELMAQMNIATMNSNGALSIHDGGIFTPEEVDFLYEALGTYNPQMKLQAEHDANFGGFKNRTLKERGEGFFDPSHENFAGGSALANRLTSQDKTDISIGLLGSGKDTMLKMMEAKWSGNDGVIAEMTNNWVSSIDNCIASNQGVQMEAGEGGAMVPRTALITKPGAEYNVETEVAEGGLEGDAKKVKIKESQVAQYVTNDNVNTMCYLTNQSPWAKEGFTQHDARVARMYGVNSDTILDLKRTGEAFNRIFDGDGSYVKSLQNEYYGRDSSNTHLIGMDVGGIGSQNIGSEGIPVSNVARFDNPADRWRIMEALALWEESGIQPTFFKSAVGGAPTRISSDISFDNYTSFMQKKDTEKGEEYSSFPQAYAKGDMGTIINLFNRPSDVLRADFGIRHQRDDPQFWEQDGLLAKQSTNRMQNWFMNDGNKENLDKLFTAFKTYEDRMVD